MCKLVFAVFFFPVNIWGVVVSNWLNIRCSKCLSLTATFFHLSGLSRKPCSHFEGILVPIQILISSVSRSILCHHSKQAIVRGGKVWGKRHQTPNSISQWRVGGVCRSMYSINALIGFDASGLWFFQTILAAHSTLRWADPIKYRAGVWMSKWRFLKRWIHSRRALSLIAVLDKNIW